MAYIREFKPGKWRAEVQKYGTRASKVFPSKDEAEKWAKFYEVSFGESVSRFRHGPSVVVDVDRPILLSAIPKRVLNAIQSVPHSYHEVLASAYTVGSGVGVYFLMLDHEIVYVGQTTDVFARLHRHQRDKSKAFNSFSFIQCKPEDLDELEAKYIDAFLPVYNRSTGQKDRRPLQASEQRSARPQTSTEAF